MKEINIKVQNQKVQIPSSDISINKKGDALNNLVEYSTQEKIVGTWINGKPIYRKVFSGLLANHFNLVNNVETIVDFGGMASISGIWRALPYSEVYQGEVYMCYMSWQNSSAVLIAVQAGKNMNEVACQCWVEYTKA